MPGLLYQQPQGLLSEPEQGTGLLGALYQNPIIARQVAAQRQAREVPTSVMDPRWAGHQAIQKQADNFLLGADILGAVAPFAKPLGLLAGRAAAPAIEGYMAKTGLLQTAAPYNSGMAKKWLSKDEMIKRGADGYLSRAYEAEIPLSKVSGREPVPAMEGGYKKGREITQPIEVVYQPENDTFILYSGNHRVRQAEINGQDTIKAFVEVERKPR